MRKSFARYLITLAVFAFVLAPLGGVGFAEPGATGWLEAKVTVNQDASGFKVTPAFLDMANPSVRAVAALQERHTPWLMAKPNVVGTAVGLTESGEPAVLVFISRAIEFGMLPGMIDGTPVVVRITGKFMAMPRPPDKGPPDKNNNKNNNKTDPTGLFPRPVPIGVSTGNEMECSAGTIGARVSKGLNTYALSNNHVYALGNHAPIGSRVGQPGRYDTECAFSADNVIGTLSEFVPIVFSTSANNRVDAAIALTSRAMLGDSTPPDGYGAPRTATVAPTLNGPVQKYGRTTAHTKGFITGINATVNIGYGSGTARFVGQIIVGANKPFLKSGDSGSLLVTNPGRNPVGLLFAGTSSGKTAIANPIGAVLNSFGVTIDGE